MAFQDLEHKKKCELLDHATDISETLSYLTYLLCIDAENPDRVRLYAEQARERVRALGSLLRSSGCEGYFNLN
jgi:hypothetical protein